MIRSIALLLLSAGLLLAAACDGEDGRDEAEMPGDEGFREFVPLLQQALDAGDMAFLTDRAQTVPYVCTEEDFSGLGNPHCESEGQSYDGFTVGYWRSEGVTAPVASALSPFDTVFSSVQPAANDEFGDGAVRVYALNVGDDDHDAIVTAIIERPEFAGSGPPIRATIGTSWSFAEARWTLTYVVVAYVGSEEFLTPSEEMQENRFPNWERYQAP